VLQSTALGFTNKEVREIMAESDANEDGVAGGSLRTGTLSTFNLLLLSLLIGACT
jgi:hypothetical protein